MKCESCESVATTQVTEVDSHGKAIARSLCEEHAKVAGFDIPERRLTPQSLDRFVTASRQMAQRLREFQEGNCEDDDLCEVVSMIMERDPKNGINRYVAYLEAAANFTEKHRRFPSDEIQHPFLK